jgi:hypothetical protein
MNVRDPRDSGRGRAVAAAIAGSLGGLLVAAVVGFAAGSAASGWSAFLRAGGWLAVALLGGGAAVLLDTLASRGAGPARSGSRAMPLLLSSLVLLAGVALGALSWQSARLEQAASRREAGLGSGSGPRRFASARAKSRAILRWSYRSPATVAQILPLARDPDPVVREQAVLALGVNLIVTDIEHATAGWPSRYASHPVRESLRVALEHALGDSLDAVRAEAARALWKAPRTFGLHPAAAETLAAVLGRATHPGAVERLAWLALDAAAGAPDPRLKAAAAHFARATSDSDLARAARLATER